MLHINLSKSKKVSRRLRQRLGFTVVELVIVLVVMGTVFPIFLSLVVGSYHDSAYSGDAIKSGNDTKQALWYMEDNIRGAAAFTATVPSNYTDPYGAHNDGTVTWSYKGDSATSRVIITKSYATSTNPLGTGRQSVFINGGTYNCTTQIYYQPKLLYITIYFVYNGTLYRRILTDTTTSLCPGNVQQQKQSCPPYIAAGSLNAICQANDEALLTQVTNFTATYYQSNSGSTGTYIDAYSSSDPTILDAADYADVTVTTSTRGGNVTNTMVQRMTKVNQ